MNIQQLHSDSKDVSFVPVFKGEAGTVTAMKIQPGKKVEKHTTNVPALLVCLAGKAVYQDEKGFNETLLPGDYVKIEPMVVHWVESDSGSDLLLIK